MYCYINISLKITYIILGAIIKGVKYNSGLYESLVITLGEGHGPNYWCVLYPPLCSIDTNKEEVEYRSYIKDLIDKYL